MTMLPVPFYPPPRYTDRTPVIVPVAVKFIRAGAIAMLEWGSLRFVDHAPPMAWIITSIIAALVLAVLECRDWLNFKRWWYFRVSLGVLLTLWVAGVAGSYARFGISPTISEQPQGFGFAEATRRPPSAPLTREAQELRSKEYVDLYNFLGQSGMKAVDLGSKIPTNYEPKDRTERLHEIVLYYDAVNALFSGLKSVTDRYPFSDLAAEFTSGRDIGETKSAVLTPFRDCLDLLNAMPDSAPIPLQNYLKDKLGGLNSTPRTLRDWIDRERQSLSVRIQGG